LEAPEQIILDENELAKDKAYFSIGTYAISPNQNLLAFSIDLKGDEIYELYLKDLTTGLIVKTPINSISEVAWLADNETVLYTTENERMQTDMCWKWNVLTKNPVAVYLEMDPGWDVSLYQSSNEQMTFLSTASKDETEVYYLKSNDLEGRFTCLLPRQSKHNYSPDYYDEKFYIRTNLFREDFDIAVCREDSTALKNWKILYQGKDKEPINGFGVFDTNLVVQQRRNGFDNLVIISRQYGLVTDAIIPVQPMDLSLWVNPDPKALVVYYTAENEITPLSIFKYDFYTQTSELVREYPPAGIYNIANYTSVIKWVKANDGAEIPLMLTYRIDLDLNAPHAVDLNGYGAYGDCNDPYFSASRLSLIDRGVIYATAHIRGGGEFGQEWYDGGRLMNKKNSFTDFVACMDYLLDNKITTKDKLVIEGGSAGGLLMGAVTNLAYDKCGLVVGDVPFVDVLHTMLDETLPLTVQEYEEWGDPHNKEAFDYISSYSPVDNVRPHAYPTMLISSAWNDTRVGYWEGAKWAAKLRANNTGTNPIIFKINWNEGHTGQVNRYESLEYYAVSMAYVLYYLGLR
jgi:oligopeptidase B